MSESHFANGYRFLQQGRFAEAITAFQEAIKEQPDSAEAHYNVGNAYIGQRDYLRALAAYRDAVRLKPGRLDCLGRDGNRSDAGRQKPPAVSLVF